ncbi:hypothetical protein Xsto_03883 [Xenorhabdus stockiae]|uniref:Uncharacterized protein n=1 Tax=Xenorhabdus stockiae TaxID=351614 RepID=A0A2D0KAS1_9GAMM|nr:hypothetical protein Xsto_03883 [Xenorhabdus stockiae]
MTKQEFKSSCSAFRKSLRNAVRQNNPELFHSLNIGIFRQCHPSNRPVSIAIWMYR